MSGVFQCSQAHNITVSLKHKAEFQRLCFKNYTIEQKVIIFIETAGCAVEAPGNASPWGNYKGHHVSLWNQILRQRPFISRWQILLLCLDNYQVQLFSGIYYLVWGCGFLHYSIRGQDKSTIPMVMCSCSRIRAEPKGGEYSFGQYASQNFWLP